MKKEYIYASISILAWSTVAFLTKLLLGTINNFQVLWVSSFFAGVSLLLFNLLTGHLKQINRFQFKDILTIILIGLPGTFLYYVFYYGATSLMPASQSLIVNYTWPIMSIIFGCVILREKMTFRNMLAVLISFVGVGVAMLGSSAELNSKFFLGALLCLLGAASYGIFTVLLKKYSYDQPLSLMINYFTTFALTTVINACSGNLFIPTGLQTAGMIWNGIFALAIADIMWQSALRLGKTEKISNLAYITPFISLIWTTLILKEPFSIFNFLGVAIIVSGIVLQFIGKKKAAV